MAPNADTKPDHYQINAKICRLVEKFPCMYDRSNPHYLKKDVVDKAWVKIAKEMDDSIPSCKERWRNIRTSFARSINVNKVPASANRTKPYYLHEELQFLARHITPGIPIPRRSNAYSSAGEESEVIEVSVGDDTFDGFVLTHDDEDDFGESHGQPERGSSVSDSNEDDKMEQRELAAETFVATLLASPLKKRRRSGDGEQQQPSIPPEQKYSAQMAAAPESDFDSIFLQGLLPEMKAMDFRQKILFKRRIYEVIGDIFENSPPPTTVSTTANAAPVHSNAKIHSNAPSSPPSSTQRYAASGSGATPAMTVVNSADLAMIRRLNNLLQNPQGSISANSILATMVAAPKHASASISSTVRSPMPSTATVAVNRGALTRSTAANLLRVTMVNSSGAAIINSKTNTAQQHVVKQEAEVLDD